MNTPPCEFGFSNPTNTGFIALASRSRNRESIRRIVSYFAITGADLSSPAIRFPIDGNKVCCVDEEEIRNKRATRSR